jgi:hypothetical protein
MSEDGGRQAMDPEAGNGRHISDGPIGPGGAAGPQQAGEPGSPTAPFPVVITGEGEATIDGDPVPMLGDQPLDTAILDTLQGYARVREGSVAATITNPATGYAVQIEVGPDGSSRVLSETSGAGSAAQGGAGPAGAGGVDPAAGPDAATTARLDQVPGAPGAPGQPHDPAELGGPEVRISPGQADAGAAGSPETGRRPAVGRMISGPAGSRPSIRRPSTSRRPSGTGGGGKRTARGSDVEFVPTSLLKKPWAVATAGVVLAALVTTPIALAGSGGEKDKKDEAGPKKKPSPSETVRPVPPDFPSTSPSMTASKKPPKKKKSPSPTKSKDKDKPSPNPTDDEGKKPAGEVKIPTGTVSILNDETYKCVDIPGEGRGKVDGRVQEADCETSESENQRWKLDLRQKAAGPGGADLYTIRNVKDNYCLDLGGFGPVPATTKVAQFHCRIGEKDNQMWWFERKSNGKYWIRNLKSGNLCLNVPGQGKEANAQLTIAGCDDAFQQWSFKNA